MLAEDIAPAAEHGGDRTGQVGITNLRREHDAGYIIARLKRDDPKLAQQVIDGTITAHARRTAKARQRYDRELGDLRRVVLSAVRRGALSEVEAARLAGISRTTLRKWREDERR